MGERSELIEYRLIRSNRKSLSLEIHPEGLVVRAPFFMPVPEIEQFIAKKQSWIEKHLNNTSVAQPAQQSNAKFRLGYGDKALFRGRECVIEGSAAMNTGKVDLFRGDYKDGAFIIGEGLSADEIRFILSRIYKREAEKYIPGRVEHYGNIMKLSPDSVRITSAFRRWGSCSGKKRLNFAWMLMMAEDAAIDAVVVHELAHMIRSNHSKDFYAEIHKYYPDYDKQHKKLNDIERRIRSEYWK